MYVIHVWSGVPPPLLAAHLPQVAGYFWIPQSIGGLQGWIVPAKAAGLVLFLHSKLAPSNYLHFQKPSTVCSNILF